MKKKKNRRSASENPDLDPKLNLKTRYDLYDQDYVDKLSAKDRAWLNKFNREYITTTLDTENRRKNLHKTKKLIKDCYDRNNARNRDILTRAKASKQLMDYEDLDNSEVKDNYEDYLIKELDKQDAREAIEWFADQLERDEENLENRLTDELEENKS